MKKFILFCSIATLFGLVSCNHDTDKKAVNDDEWKEAIENIVNYKKNNKLNYVANGDVLVTVADESGTDTQHFKKIECNDNVSFFNAPDESGLTFNEYSLKDGMFYFTLEETIDSSEGKTRYYYNVTTYPLPEIFNLVLDVYDYKSYFNYTNGRYIIKDDKSEIPGCKFHVELEFYEKKIKEIVINYEIKEEAKTIKIEGYLDFTYGNSTLSASSFPTESKWEEHKADIFLTLDDDNYYKKESFQLDKRMSLRINAGESIGNKKTITFVDTSSNPYYLFFNDDKHEIYVYKNKVLLTKGKDASSTGDYYFSNPRSTGEERYQNLIFKENLKEADKIEIFIEHFCADTCSCSLVE